MFEQKTDPLTRRVKENSITQGDAWDLVGQVEDRSVDLIVCDGPYGVSNHAWDKVASVQEINLNIIKHFSGKLKDGGSLYLFGKHDCLHFIDYRPYLKLISQVIWYQPSRLSQGRMRYTNNYDVICYFVKGSRPNVFNLDAIRVPQLVELAHRLRCENVPSVTQGKYGKTKFNALGKNPGDVWGDIKQLTYKSKELVDRQALNTIQKPEKLIERIILASSREGDLVLDPFCGSGTCPSVCLRLNRRFIAFEKDETCVNWAESRLNGTASQQVLLHG